MESGCFTVTTLSFRADNISFIGLRFLTSDLGLIWRCGYSIQPYIVKEISKKDIAAIVKEIND